MPKVSIILPVYNVEQFLSRCLESIESQTLKDIEIIAINDGSTDDSFYILRNHGLKDSRIIIIDKKNEGLSETRNKGIEAASGEYITFVDSDDWISENMLEDMYNEALRNNSDVVLCSYFREYEQRAIPKIFNLPEVAIYENGDVHTDLYRKLVGPIGNEISTPENLHSLITAWGKLYRTSILKDNNIKFIGTSIIGTEDCLFNIQVFKDVSSAVFLNKPYYHYWKGNITSLTSTYKPKLIKQWEVMYTYIRDVLDSYKFEEEFYEALNNRICLSTLGLGLNECCKANKVSEFKKINNIKQMLNERYIVNAFKNFNSEHLPIHWKLFYFFNKHKIALPSYLMLRSIELMRKVI